VRAQLQLGPVTQKEFDREPAIDGGDRVGRLAARIHELRKLEWVIQTKRGPGGFAIYTLLSEPLDAELVIGMSVAAVAKLRTKPEHRPVRKRRRTSYPYTADAIAMFEVEA
jgi:hypothetical protein